MSSSLMCKYIINRITRFYSLTIVAVLLLRLDSNFYSLLVGSICWNRQTDRQTDNRKIACLPAAGPLKHIAVKHPAAWKRKRLDSNPGSPDTKQPPYHLCYLASLWRNLSWNRRKLNIINNKKDSKRYLLLFTSNKQCSNVVATSPNCLILYWNYRVSPHASSILLTRKKNIADSFING